MPQTTNQILVWIGLSTATHRQAIKSDMMPDPDGIAHLVNENADGIQDACASYPKRNGNDSFRVSRVHMRRLISLMYWVQDRERLRQDIEFDDSYDRVEFLTDIEEARERHEFRKDQRKKGEALLGTEFQTKLKNRNQWDRWQIELEANLQSIIGASGIPISYIIRGEATPDLTAADWDERAFFGAPLDGRAFRLDAATVHRTILQNIADDSDAYTYVKGNIRRENGRLDIIALRERYENDAAVETRINEAKRSLEVLQYRNERSMTFERFSAKLQKALDDLEEGGRRMHDADVVDMIWTKINNTELHSFVTALKATQTRQPLTYQEILQQLASEVPKLPKAAAFKPNRNVSATDSRHTSEASGGKGVTRDGTCPGHGAHTKNGKLFIGNYPGHRWNDDDVRPHHDAIRAARQKSPKTKEEKKTENQPRQKRRKLSQLQVKVEQLEARKKKAGGNKSDGSDDSGADDEAGNAFGGKRSMSGDGK